jgi:hypothetical protein
MSRPANLACWGLVALILLLAACVSDPGGGSDTETLTGVVLMQNGTRKPDAIVKLFPADYDPRRPSSFQVRTTVSDDSGRFRFTGVGKRYYNLIAVGKTKLHVAYRGNVQAGPEDHVLRTGPMRVFIISLYDERNQPTESGTFYFPGTDIMARCDGVKPAVVDSVPYGLDRVVVESRSGWRHDTDLAWIGDTVAIEAFPDGIHCKAASTAKRAWDAPAPEGSVPGRPAALRVLQKPEED